MFGNPSKPSKIYRYGCLQPIQGLDSINEQIRKMHEYRNNLCRLELDRRERWNTIVETICQGSAAAKAAVESAEEELEQINADIAAERIIQRRKKITGPLPERRKEMIVILKAQRAILKYVKRLVAADPKTKAALDALEESTNEAKKKLRAESGLYWGNKSTIENDTNSFRTGRPPKFRRWNQEGRIAVQLQKGIPTERALAGTDTRFRIVMTGRFGVHRNPLAECWFRMDSDEKRRPIWAVIPMVYHRPLPKDGAIKWCYLHRRRCGTIWRWELSIVVARDDWPVEDAAQSGKVAIDVGYKQADDGLLVARWVGDDGDSGELIIATEDMEDRWKDAAQRRSIRDHGLGIILEALSDWIKGRGGDLPDWFAEAVRSLPQWRSQARLAGLILRWARNRFDGDGKMFAECEQWRKDDERKYNSEAGLRARAIRWREHLYRNFVAGLRRRYKTAKVREVDYSWVAGLPANKHVPDVIRENRFIAAPGRLVQLIEEGFAEFQKIKVAKTEKKKLESVLAKV